MGGVAGPLDLLDHEAPAGRALDRELDLTAGEPSEPRTHVEARSRRDPAAADLTRLPVERLVRDLVSMHIQRHYDSHRDLLELRRLKRHRVTTTLEPEGVSLHVISLMHLASRARREPDSPPARLLLPRALVGEGFAEVDATTRPRPDWRTLFR